MDEPTIGLDAVASKQIRTFLKDVNESRGTTILLTSHYMEDIKVLYKRSIVVNHGRKIYDGDTDLLFEQYQKTRRMTIYFEHSARPDVPEYCRVLEQTDDKLVLEIPKQNAERADTFVDVILAVAKILFAWILWGILFEGKEQIAGLGFQAMISYYIIIPVRKIC